MPVVGHALLESSLWEFSVTLEGGGSVVECWNDRVTDHALIYSLTESAQSWANCRPKFLNTYFSPSVECFLFVESSWHLWIGGAGHPGPDQLALAVFNVGGRSLMVILH